MFNIRRACVFCPNMRVVALVVVCGLIVAQDAGSVGAAVPGLDSEQRTRGTGGKPHKMN